MVKMHPLDCFSTVRKAVDQMLKLGLVQMPTMQDAHDEPTIESYGEAESMKVRGSRSVRAQVGAIASEASCILRQVWLAGSGPAWDEG